MVEWRGGDGLGEDFVSGNKRFIATRPAVAAAELAAETGLEKPVFKSRIRRLKELGLTESLETGYRLSPRGERVHSFRRKAG